MVDKTKKVPLGELSAYERWELPNIGDPAQVARQSEVSRQEKIKPPTAEQIESITKQAYESGFEEGHRDGFDKGSESGHAEGYAEGLKAGQAEGYQQGLAQAESEINQQKALLQSLMAELVNPIELQRQVIEEAMLNVSVALSRAVIHRELSLDSSSLSTALSQIVEELPASDSGSVARVNPSDLDLVKSTLDNLGATIDVIVDPNVQAGGFTLKTSTQLIDFTVEKRFQKAVQGMLDSAVNKRSTNMQEVPSTIDALSDYSANTLNEELEPSSESDNSELNDE
jgi:flagellar assembly protein FliH